MLVVAFAAGLSACRAGPGRQEPGSAGDERARGGAHPARLQARPRGRVRSPAPTGLRLLDLEARRDSYLYVPESYDRRKPAPFVLMLHGAGRTSRRALSLFRPRAPRMGAILFAPQSAGVTWDVTLGAYGEDVDYIERALRFIFARYAIDSARVAIGGFSDGASYALSLGITNGDLFRSIVAISPGFMAPGPPSGRPRIFVAHGRRDDVLPLESTSARIVPRLRAAGYDVTYMVHGDGHSPMPRLNDAFDWLARAR
jgi:phospholipase/carboxylesterase